MREKISIKYTCRLITICEQCSVLERNELCLILTLFWQKRDGGGEKERGIEGSREGDGGKQREKGGEDGKTNTGSKREREREREKERERELKKFILQGL